MYLFISFLSSYITADDTSVSFQAICDAEALECDMDFPPGFGPSLEFSESSLSASLLDDSCENKISGKPQSSPTVYYDPSSGVQVIGREFEELPSDIILSLERLRLRNYNLKASQARTS